MPFLVAKLPNEIRPNHSIRSQAWTAESSGKRYGASIGINTDGRIHLVSGGDFAEAGFTVSYPL